MMMGHNWSSVKLHSEAPLMEGSKISKKQEPFYFLFSPIINKYIYFPKIRPYPSGCISFFWPHSAIAAR